MTADEVKAIMSQNEDLGYAFHIIDADSSAVVKEGTPMQGTRYTKMYGDVAVMNLFGPIFPRASMMNMSTEGMSLEMFVKEFASVYSNPGVKGLVLNSDSPGGDARGLGDAADFMFKMTQKGNKPFLSFASGYMASASYYLSAPAHRIIASKSAMVGSIGTVMSFRKGDNGTLDIVSSISPKKRPDVNTADGVAVYQQKVDDLGKQFAGDVAKYRNVSLDKVLADYGQGDYMFGPRAKAQGLVDGIGTLGSVIDMASKMAKDETGASFRRTTKATSEAQMESALDVLHFSEETQMGFKELLAKFTASAEQEQAQPDATANESDTPAVAEEGQGQEDKIVALPTREELEEEFSDTAELFATQLMVGHQIVPAMQAHAVCDLINAKIDDKLSAGAVSFVNERGELVSGTREEAVRARYASMPKHSMTQQTIGGIKEGTVTAKVLSEVDVEKVPANDGPMSEERRLELLGKTSQGQAALASKA